MPISEIPKMKFDPLSRGPARGFGVLTAVSMLGELADAAKILQDRDTRAEMLINQAAQMNALNPEFSGKLIELPAFGPFPMVLAPSYELMRDVLRLGLNRFVLQGVLKPIIGAGLASDKDDWLDAAKLSRPHTAAGPDHTAIARRDIQETFSDSEILPKLTSPEGISASELAIEMIHRIMTDTVFGGTKDPVVADWKDDIVYFLQHLIDVQQSYAVGLLSEKLLINVPKALKRSLMKYVAKKQGVSDVLEEMLRIEDTLFPRIDQWIEAQQNNENLDDDQLASMGFLGAVLLANKAGQPLIESRAGIFGIYTAALDSTASAVTWLFGRLGQHPGILRKLASLTGDARKQYIQFILFELWRKDPITPIIFRQVPAEGTGNRSMQNGTRLAPNTIVLLSPGASGLDPDRFINPHAFNPDRYFDMTIEEVARVKKDLELVFAAGDKHRCQGEKAAQQTLATLLDYMADNFDRIVIVPSKDGENVDIQSNRSGVCSPVRKDGSPLRVRFVPRSDLSVSQQA